MYDISVKISGYKCFKEPSGFETISRVNLIIGRNNSGKSSLLDMIESVSSNNYTFSEDSWNDKEKPAVTLSVKINEEDIKRSFRANTAGGLIPGNHIQYGRQFISRAISWEHGSQVTNSKIDDHDISPPISKLPEERNKLSQSCKNPLGNKIFKRLQAERDLEPEQDSGGPKIGNKGTSITNTIQKFINRSHLPSELIEKTLLNAMNEIFAHDAHFTRITCQLHDQTSQWEIFFEEEYKGRIALSKSGSGLKTVLAVLAHLILLPEIESKKLSGYIFAFEELENNIHPALLRRLNQYIYKMSKDNDFIYFLTTHSNVLIDQFSKQNDAQIIHVRHQNGESKCVTAKTYIDNNGVLDDLDIRASDLLQANGVIWVEGPSDRIYLNHWINLWSNGELHEGAHYQIVFYGGRLLSHLSAEDPEDHNELISIFNTNRNAAILIDSDKRKQNTPINSTKKRIQKEFEEKNSLCWITKGREIENYIPKEVVDNYYGKPKNYNVEQYGLFFDILDEYKKGDSAKFSTKKTILASELLPQMNIEVMKNVLDLDNQMQVLCDSIRSWNS